MSEETKVKEIKSERVMELFFRAIKGEALSAQKIAEEHHVSTRSVTRDINNLKCFLSEHSDIIGNAELVYSGSTHCYHLKLEHFLTNKELLAITKILIGSRAFNQEDLRNIIQKLKMNTSTSDRATLEQLLHKELLHYREIGSDCHSVIEHVWKLTDCIKNRKKITITYYKMNRHLVNHKIKPVSIMFSEYYFYLIAYKEEETANVPLYFRIDRIADMTIHRETYTLALSQNIDEGILRQKSQFMWPGPNRRIRFEFTGPSVQAILDRIPTAKIIQKNKNSCLIEAEVYGDGIKMFLLSQGHWVKVISPESFVAEMKEEINKMHALY